MRTLRRACVALVLAALVAPAAHAAPPLVGQWSFEGTTDANRTAFDSSGNGLTATSAFAPNLVAGRFGQALDSDGAYRTGESPLTAPARVTLLAWIQQPGDPGQLKYIAGRGNDGPGTCLGSSYALYNSYSGYPGLRFYIRSTGGDTVLSPSVPATSVYDGRWHMVAGTFDGTAARLYIDGVQAGTGSPVQPGAQINYALANQDSTAFVMKAYSQPACGPSTFPGPIDEVRLYDRALTQTELKRLADAPGNTPPVLVPDGALGSNPLTPGRTPVKRVTRRGRLAGIKARGRRVKGKVSVKAPCKTGRKVVVTKGSKVLGKTKSKAGGKFNIKTKKHKKGKLTVKVRKRTVGNTACKALKKKVPGRH